MLDKEWTGPHPIYAYLIDHPEGLLLVDTGDTARKSEHGYMLRLNPFFRYCIEIRVAPEEEIGTQLPAMAVNSRPSPPDPHNPPPLGYRFRVEGEAPRVMMRAEVEPRGAVRLLGLLAAVGVRRQLETSHRRLKGLLGG